MFTTLQKRILYCIYKRERWFKVRIWKTSLAYTTLKRQIAGDFFKVGETAANSSESCEDASCLETLFILARVSWQMFSLALLTSFSIQYSIVKKQTYLATFATVLKYIGCPFNNTFFFFRDLTSFMAFRMITKEKAEKCFRRWPVWILFSVSVIKSRLTKHAFLCVKNENVLKTSPCILSISSIHFSQNSKPKKKKKSEYERKLYINSCPLGLSYKRLTRTQN